jgi:long-chain acyl-CoA synthetase
MLTGSAPIHRDVIDFLKISAGCPIYEGYGLTESTCGSFLTLIWDPQSGHVGGPLI